MQETLSHLLSEAEARPQARLVKLETTDDLLTSRAGLAPFVRYLERIAVLPLTGGILGPVKKHAKGSGWANSSNRWMVMDNDEAPQREEATPTYKKVKGFQPLDAGFGETFSCANTPDG